MECRLLTPLAVQDDGALVTCSVLQTGSSHRRTTTKKVKFINNKDLQHRQRLKHVKDGGEKEGGNDQITLSIFQLKNSYLLLFPVCGIVILMIGLNQMLISKKIYCENQR